MCSINHTVTVHRRKHYRVNTVSDPGPPIYATEPGTRLRPRADISGTDYFREQRGVQLRTGNIRTWYVRISPNFLTIPNFTSHFII